MNETNKIDWECFQSKFLRIEPGTQARVKLTNWRQEFRTFNESETPKPALVFDVLRANNLSYENKPLEWSTTSFSLTQEFKVMIDNAKEAKRNFLYVIMKRQTDKKYIVLDISEPESVPPYEE